MEVITPPGPLTFFLFSPVTLWLVIMHINGGGRSCNTKPQPRPHVDVARSTSSIRKSWLLCKILKFILNW